MSNDRFVPGSAYENAAKAFAAISAGEGDDLHPQARSTLLSHGGPSKEAFLLLHGLTASPGQWRPFADRLFLDGANVFVPLLPHHGRRDRMTLALEEVTAAGLATFARHAIVTARGLGERLTVIGFSLGGLLGAWMAQYGPVDRAVLISPFLGSSLVPMAMTPRVARLVLRRSNRFIWWDPIRRDRLLPEYGYPRFSTHAVAEALLLADHLYDDAVRRAPRAPDISFLINSGETAVDNRAVVRLARAWKAHGAGVRVRSQSFPPSHDIIEMYQNERIAMRAHGTLFDLLQETAEQRSP